LNIKQVIEIVDGRLVSGRDLLNLRVRYGLGADLMSDALLLGQEGILLITGLTNPQAIRTAEMVGAHAVLFVRAKLPPPETVRLAEEASIALLATRYTLYEASGRLYQAGLAGLGPSGEFIEPQ
jgi:hypothetical protein